MSRIAKSVAIILLVFAPSACVSRTVYMAEVNRARGLAESLQQLEPYLRQLEAENKGLKGANDKLKLTAKDADWIRQQKTKLAKLIEEFDKKGGSAGIPGVKVIKNDRGDVGLRIEDGVLFPSGMATLSKQGRETLSKLVPMLRKGNAVVRVDGHTDSDPIVRSSWKSNLHLSVGRSLAVAEQLHKLGFAYDKILVAGFGPSKPVSKSPADKASNRRVELYLVQ